MSKFVRAILMLTIALLFCLPAHAQRQRILLDSGWQFNEGDINGIDAYAGGTPIVQWKYLVDPNGPNDTATYAAAGFNDSSWSTATAGQNVFSQQGYAWFRVNLQALVSSPNDVAPHNVVFENVQDNATVYLNGHLVKAHVGAGEQFQAALDPYWVAGGPNELAVLVQSLYGSGFIQTASLFLGSSPLKTIGTTGYNDSTWTSVHLPHDYVVQGAFTTVNTQPDHGYLPTVPAWYRKSFTVPASAAGSDVWIDFDGAYRNSVVYVNGHFIGMHASGYIGFRYDVTPYLNFGGQNEIAVHVDPSWYEGWWYEGGGIYRHVWLNIASPVHVAPWGAYVTSTVTGTTASESISTTVANTSSSSQNCTLQSTLYDPNGAAVYRTASNATVPANSSITVAQSASVSNPMLWSLTTPSLYRLNTEVVQNGSPVDSVNTPFGIRTIQYTPNGFYLNGQHVYLQGTCNHEDFIGVGSGMPDSVLYYRLKQLKAMGCNAYRTSHGPTNPELLDYCDQLGILVMDENRHIGDSYYTKGQVGDPYSDMSDLDAMIMRDRNHPSVIMWSMCNEEWNLQWSTVGETMLAAMRSSVRSLDTTRPVTTADNGSYGDPSFCQVEDIIGINYNYWVYPYIQSYFPGVPDFASETASSFSTRGVYADDATDCWSSAYDTDSASWGATVEASWQAILSSPNMAGGFYWTGFDYLGEETPYAWPAVSTQFGSIDRCGFPKDDFYFNQSAWTATPMVHVLPHWNWTSNHTISVWVYSNCTQVELFLNGTSLGVQTVIPDSHLTWNVPWVSGTLTALGYEGGTTLATDSVNTAGAAYAIRLTPTKTNLADDGEDLSVVKVSIVDSLGNVVPTAGNEVTFSVSGPGHLAGVGNGNPSSHELEQGTQRAAFNGLCAALVQSNDQQTGSVTLTATSPGLVSGALTLNVGPAPPSGLAAVVGTGQVSLSWTPVNGVTYNVYRGVYSGGELSTPIATGLGTASYTDATVNEGVPYFYTIATVNSYGTSGYSNEALALLPLPAPSSFTISPSSIYSGESATGTVTISSPATGAGATVPITSDNPAVTVPANVTVPAGSTTVQFSVLGNLVSGAATANITAGLGTQTLTTPVTVYPNSVATIGLSSASVIGGGPVTGTVTLYEPAGPGGVTVSLSSSDSFASVPTGVIVLAGQSSASFPITTDAVSATDVVTISATVNGMTQTATLTLGAQSIVSLTLSPSTIFGGYVGLGTVTLAGPVPSGVATVSLSSSKPSAAATPSSVAVQYGQTTVSFPITTTNISSTATAVTISAQLAGSGTPTTSVLTVAPLGVASVSVSPNTVLGGSVSTGTVYLSGPAPSPNGQAVSLSLGGAAQTVNVPGGASSTTFAVPTAAVAVETPETISASINGVAQTTTLNIEPSGVLFLSVDPSSLTGGSPASATVTLAGPAPSSGTVVSLSGSSTDVQAPLSCTVPVGQTSVSIPVTTSAVSASESVTITATSGGQSATSTITLLPASLSSVSLSPATVVGGGTSVGTVTLSGSAPAGGITVTLSSDQAQAVVPSSVTIPAGSASTTFAVTTTGGLSQTIAHITATYGSASQSASLTIGTLSLVSVSVSPIYITSGQPATGTVSISGPAPSGGVTVNLSSSTPGIVNVGGSVSIPANATSATFAVTTGVTGAQVTSTVTGTIGASSASSTVTVTPAAGVSFGKGISLISVPYDYPGVSPSSVIGPVNTDVILAVWNPLTSAYALTPTAPAGDVRLGRGYWAGLQSAGTLLYFGTPAPTNQNFGISVDKGWNQIGDPFLSGVPLGSLTVTSGSQTVSFAQAVSNGWIYGTVYGYTGGSSNSYYSAGLLATGSGYWLYAFQPVTVTVPHP